MSARPLSVRKSLVHFKLTVPACEQLTEGEHGSNTIHITTEEESKETHRSRTEPATEGKGEQNVKSERMGKE